MIPPSTYVSNDFCLTFSLFFFFFFFSIDDTQCMKHEDIHSREIKLLDLPGVI
jgi:hypothetical protein